MVLTLKQLNLVILKIGQTISGLIKRFTIFKIFNSTNLAIRWLIIPGVPKKSSPKIKVFYKKSWSVIISKPYCPNTLGSPDMIL